MKKINADIVVIGAGPAGLAAAIESKKQGAKNIIILERDSECGGILQQCIHDGFGLQRFQKRLSGPQYAQRFIDELEKSDIQVYLSTMVLELTKDKIIYACNSKDGMLKIEAKAIILAMGCRERTQFQAFIYGSRPSGVLTAGAVQRYINIEGYLPGKEAVILGSGDIGLIMARRMTLEGMKVKGVYEVMASPGGLTRNIVQCLDDYDIPMHLATTVTEIHGKDHVESITVAKVDENRKPIAGTEEVIDCDLLVLAVGLIPENELSEGADIEIDSKTKGPVLDENFMTSIPGVFAAGNVAAVFDLVDYVSASGEIAARGAMFYVRGEIEDTMEYTKLTVEDNINFVVPQRLSNRAKGNELTCFMRVKSVENNVFLTAKDDQSELYRKKEQHVAPPEMISCTFPVNDNLNIKLSVKEG